MEKEVERIENKIGRWALFVMGSLFLIVSYNVFVWNYANIYAVGKDGFIDKNISFFISFLLIMIILAIFIAISMSLQEFFLQITLQKRFPAVNTYETLHETVFVEASLLMEKNEKTDLQMIIDKIKKRNVDIETLFLSSLHNQSVEKLTCSICEKEIRMAYGRKVTSCGCKSIEKV